VESPTILTTEGPDIPFIWNNKETDKNSDEKFQQVIDYAA